MFQKRKHSARRLGGQAAIVIPVLELPTSHHLVRVIFSKYRKGYIRCRRNRYRTLWAFRTKSRRPCQGESPNSPAFGRSDTIFSYTGQTDPHRSQTSSTSSNERSLPLHRHHQTSSSLSQPTSSIRKTPLSSSVDQH
jgi:hypothetical protein